jgi:excisionase family DNA binding protein
VFLRVPELAERFGLPTACVYRLLREGVIPGVYIGRSVRIDEDQLKDWIEQGGQRFAAGWRKAE